MHQSFLELNQILPSQKQKSEQKCGLSKIWFWWEPLLCWLPRSATCFATWVAHQWPLAHKGERIYYPFWDLCHPGFAKWHIVVRGYIAHFEIFCHPGLAAQIYTKSLLMVLIKLNIWKWHMSFSSSQFMQKSKKTCYHCTLLFLHAKSYWRFAEPCYYSEMPCKNKH